MDAMLLQLFDSSSSSEESSSSSSESEDEPEIIPREPHEKIQGYCSIVDAYSYSDFRAHFRLSRASVEMLLRVLENQYIGVRRHPPFPFKHAILMSLWTLANQESFRGVADRFGVSRGHCHRVFLCVCQLLCNNVQRWIRWPAAGLEQERCLQGFSNLRAVTVPGTFAVIDGTHIPIPGPLHDESFYNRKGFHSVLAQIVCTHDFEIIDLFCGFPGSCHDARMWAESPLCQRLQEHPGQLLPDDAHILADSAYPITTRTLTPFKNDGHLTPEQKYFNTVGSSSRVVVEQTIGKVKCRFRRLRYLHINNLSYAKYIITASCILHNIRIKEPEGDEDDIDYDSDDHDDHDDPDFDEYLAEDGPDNHGDGRVPYNRVAERVAGQNRRIQLMTDMYRNRPRDVAA
nr:PREDICTED: putative nuclease HARBI1 [Bemisia tabaci]